MATLEKLDEEKRSARAMLVQTEERFEAATTELNAALVSSSWRDLERFRVLYFNGFTIQDWMFSLATTYREGDFGEEQPFLRVIGKRGVETLLLSFQGKDGHFGLKKLFGAYFCYTMALLVAITYFI